MIRITSLLWVALLVIAGGTVMHVSYQVRHVEQHLTELRHDTRQEQDAIRILSAEWDTLNDPKRIDALSKRYLALEPTPIARVVALEAIPLKPSEEQLAKLAAATAKAPKGQAPAPLSQVAARKPSVLIKATMPEQRPVPAPQGGAAQDGVGLILARIERRE